MSPSSQQAATAAAAAAAVAASTAPAGVRNGARGEDVCAVKVTSTERLRIAGVNGSSGDGQHCWLRLWEKHTQRSAHLQGCAALRCTQNPSCGGHLEALESCWFWRSGARRLSCLCGR
ncbi:hypothetical protein OEZ85_004039 [Tetradesmus obliquus]|uniref:Secreted protein n=1 Tax=Tetradesmus obliquus TaxID=3088 RepID=A0ABY8UDH6_TETOB|nr:hypothetical protein OEZ85_004039 [Tetradesmus obliquus]